MVYNLGFVIYIFLLISQKQSALGGWFYQQTAKMWDVD